ncbi:MAG: nitroreductase family protein [Chloroflexales bacterium]|nr:nitroreductase family protein [Chloroflexales bacterium]
MTTKSAVTDHPIHPLLEARWSPRAFAPTPVAPEQLLSLLEAARWSASGGNVQPWSFLVVPRDDEAAFAQLLGTLVEGNRIWAQHAPLLVLTVAQQQREPGTPNPYALYDLGQAVANLTVQATALGLSVHQLAGFDPEQARGAFAIPENHTPFTVLVIGAQGDPATLPEPLYARELAERTRKPLGSFVFGGAWGQPVSLLEGVTQEG